MSDILHEDTFHGTKKGGRRKTVSKRRAYVNTPMALAKKVFYIADLIELKKYKLAISECHRLAKQLSPKIHDMHGLDPIPRRG